MRVGVVAVGLVLGLGLACGGSEPAGVDAPLAPAAFDAPPWDGVGTPGPPFDGFTVVVAPPRRTIEKDLTIDYGAPHPAGGAALLAAWRDAQAAKGWTVRSEGEYVHLERPGQRLRLKVSDNGPRWLNVMWHEEKLVREDWPRDPMCPAESRLDPKPRDPGLRQCYRVGTELEEHGPFERVVDGQVVAKGQWADGEEVGTWTERWTDPGDDETVYDYVVTWAADGSSTHAWTDANGVVALKGEEDAKGRRAGDWVWASGEVVPFDEGWPEPSFAEIAGGVRGGFLVPLEVLDVDVAAGKVAFRHLEDPPEGGELCLYPGMEAYAPGTGVILGVHDVATGTSETWTVYEAVADPARCTSEAASKAALTAAKARFAELGLDPARKPAPIEATRDGATWTVTAAGSTVGLTVEDYASDYPIVDVWPTALGASTYSDVALGRWTGVPRLPMYLTVDKSAAGAAELRLVGAWEEDGRALVAWRAVHQPCCSYTGFLSVP